MIPETVKIGLFTYTIEGNDDRMPESDTGYRVGEIDYERLRIRLKNTLSDQVKIQTLWHEIIHGILNNAGNPDKSQAETVIDAISVGLIQVLRDNPELAQLTLGEQFVRAGQLKADQAALQAQLAKLTNGSMRHG